MTEPAIKKTNVHIVLTEIVDSLREDLEQLGVEIRIPKHLPTIMCDRIHIGEVFKNLVSNAIKFNDKSQKWVEVSYLEDLDSAPGKPILEGTEVKVYPYIFYVRDNGIGIRPRHLESIFRIFKRLHGREQFGGGTGAGLTIVKRIIERHGGQIWVESTYGEGTTFYFTLQGCQ
jgi:light-regulated signal transduction histidine kinase (bacteriophytochrome)